MSTATKKVVQAPHTQAAKKTCHCSPNPHHSCVHTARSAAAKKAATAKSAKTRAKTMAEAQKYLTAHPPTKAQVDKVIHDKTSHVVTGNGPLIGEKMPNGKTRAAPKALTSSQAKAAHAKRVTAALKGAATRKAHGKTHAPHAHLTKTQRATLAGAKQVAAARMSIALAKVRGIDKAKAAAKVKHHRKRHTVTNAHTQALKAAKQRKC